MFVYEKKLQYPVKVATPNPKLAAVIISQYGGPDGELGASLRYLSQRYSMPYPELKGLLTDIGTEVRDGLRIISLPPETPLLRGDWLAFSTTERRVTNHCGLVWPEAEREGYRMLHAINGRGVSFAPLGGWWLRRLTRHFRIVTDGEAAWA